jgi:hypothetical protein
MSVGFEKFLTLHNSLLPELNQARGGKERLFPIRLPPLSEERQFQAAWLVIPPGYPNQGLAKIRLSEDAVLKLPHVESKGDICLDGDYGAVSGNSPEDRINVLLRKFYLEFLEPWLTGDLDADFGAEAFNYWAIHVSKSASSYDAVTRIYTVDNRIKKPRVYQARLMLPSRIIIAGNNSSLADRFIQSLGNRAKQINNVLIADIPISYELTPSTWPCKQSDLERLISSRLSEDQRHKFGKQSGRRGRAIHRIVILRAPRCSFGFLLSGGPPTVVEKGCSKRAYPTRQMLPLLVDRIDPSWTYGRDQHTEVINRQQQHILVLGAGALGSAVIDQLAKAGIGRISVVDPDILTTANIGRHLLGAESIGRAKADGLTQRISLSNPAIKLDPFNMSAQAWINKYTLIGVDVILDLTGESEVRWFLEIARDANPCPLLIGWMEPYVAAAHACMLPMGEKWMFTAIDPLESLQAIDWPEEVMQKEPACSSEFQAYTPAAAAHAVALVSEAALALIDKKITRSIVRSWVRGQNFLDAHYPDLKFRNWSEKAASFDGISIERILRE